MPDRPLFKPLPVFETENLILRELRLDDAQDMFEYAQDDEIAGFGLWLPQKTLQENIDDLQNAINAYAEGMALDWAVEHRIDHKMIGRVQCARCTGGFGVCLQPTVLGQGLRDRSGASRSPIRI